MAGGFNLGGLGNLGNLANLGGVVTTLTGGDGKVDVADVMKLVQSNPQLLQTAADAISKAKPDGAALQALQGAVREIVSNAPAEKVDSEVKAASKEETAGGVWSLLQPYLGKTDTLSRFLPLVEKYAPQAMETLKTLAGNLPFLK